MFKADIAQAENVDLDDVRKLLDRQIAYNTTITEEGLTGKYGAAIGRTLLMSYGNTVHNRAKVWAAAGVMYLHGGKLPEIAHTVVNALAINSGVMCDDAKARCAAKIVSAVESGLLGMQMQNVYARQGILPRRRHRRGGC